MTNSFLVMRFAIQVFIKHYARNIFPMHSAIYINISKLEQTKA